jgi:hypothetical protein
MLFVASRQKLFSCVVTLLRIFSDILPLTYSRICRDHQRQFCRYNICTIIGSVDAAISMRLAEQFSAWKICKFAVLIYAGVVGHIAAQKTFNFS